MSYRFASFAAPFAGRPLNPNVHGWNAPPPVYQRSDELASHSPCTSLRTVKFLVGRSMTSPNRSRLFIELKNGNRAYTRGVGSTAKNVPCVPSAAFPSPLE